VPLLSSIIPAATEIGFLSYKNVKFSTFTRDFTRRFIPIASTTSDDLGLFVKTPKISTNDLTRNHYGMSFLFVKQNLDTTAVQFIRSVISFKVAFYSYDGNNGLARREK
jgi:hypothetical protein